MPSRFSKTSRLYGFLYGELEGEYRFRLGRMTYSFDSDQFRLYDLEGTHVYGSDLGEDVERWLVKNGWTGGSA